MSRKPFAKEQIVKLIVGAGQASPSPPVGPALGSKGVKSMDFCKEFNALTSHYHPSTPIPCLITIRPDRTFHFILRTPPTSTLLLLAAGVPPSKGSKPRGANAPGRTSSLSSSSITNLSSAATSGGLGGKSTASSAGGGVGQGVSMSVAKGAGGDKGVGFGGGSTQVGEVSLKHVWEIAKIKQSEERLKGLSLEGLVRSVVAQARSVGVGVVP